MFYIEDWRAWIRREHVAEVAMVTVRDDVCVDYQIRLTLRRALRFAYEEGEAQSTIWTRRVHFGATDATVAGGTAFGEAAREQQAIADEIAGIVWGAR